MGKKNCQELIDGISALLYQFMTGPNQSGGVVASRLYKAPSSSIGASVTLKIQEFSDIKIKIMLKKYLVHYEDVIRLLFDGREDLVTLCRNPFYLALLTNYVSDRGNVLPKNQMELYHNFVEGRLRRCGGKLEKENLSEKEIHRAAKELASFMQQKNECGLECPTDLFYQREDEEYWRKVFSVLKYAKICRLGGEEETISFVHRRFQEFFLVENIIDRQQEIEYEYYRDILSDAGMRDAMVLYCEVAEEEKAIEIANFCWKTVQENIKFADDIHTKEGQELVRVLYFMKEAFQNRKAVLSNFIEDFYQLVKDIFDKTNKDEENICIDYVIMLALVNSMVLFSNTQLNNLVLMVFGMKNRWLNDIIMQNCRTLDTLDYHIENGFVHYFTKMDIRMFAKRFLDMRFSLSMSEKFRYVRKMHTMTMIINMTYILMTVSTVIILAVYVFEYFLSGKTFEMNLLWNLFLKNDLNVKNNVIISSPLIISALFSSLIYIGFIVIPIGRFFRFRWDVIFIETILCSSLLNNMKVRIVSIVEVTIYAVVTMTCVIVIYKHDFEFYSKNRIFASRILKSAIRKIGKSILAFILSWTSIVIILCFSQRIFAIVSLILLFVLFMGLTFVAVYCGIHYLKDCMWIRKNSVESNYMQRTQLETNLGNLYFNRKKYKYLELLLLQSTELTGRWKNGDRPQYSDDRLNHLLAKLDCIKLDSCDYLF